MRAECVVLAVVLTLGPAVAGADVGVTGIQAVHRHGQTFVTWKDVAEGVAGAPFRYALYRSDRPLTRDNLAQAELCYRGVHHNSAKLYGSASNRSDRLDLAKPYSVVVYRGKPLPPWSSRAVHTVRKPGRAYYAVVTTDEKLTPLGGVAPRAQRDDRADCLSCRHPSHAPPAGGFKECFGSSRTGAGQRV